MKARVLSTIAVLLIAIGAAGSDDLGKIILEKFDRVPLAHLPTPLESMPSLSEELDGPPLYIKRDDQTGLAFGGNKARKLEFIFADVLHERSDVIVTWAGIQSNWARQTAAAARIHGIRPILVLTKGERSPHHNGNLLLDAIMGADVRLIEPGTDRDAVVAKIVAELRENGHRPYVVPVGGSVPRDSMELPLGAIAYANGFVEMHEQGKRQGFEFDHVVVATGSGGTQAGLMVGAKVVDPDVRVIGISVSGEKNAAKAQVARIANATAEALGLSISFTADETVVMDDYIGEAYGVVNDSVAGAMKMIARYEGVMLDPVYTGKAMAGMIDLVRKGYFQDSKGVIFIHTGGTPAIFAYEEELLKYLGDSMPR